MGLDRIFFENVKSKIEKSQNCFFENRNLVEIRKFILNFDFGVLSQTSDCQTSFLKIRKIRKKKSIKVRNIYVQPVNVFGQQPDQMEIR